MKSNSSKCHIAAFLFFCAVSFCAAQAEGVSLNIRFYDKKVYFDEGDPIFILVTVSNNSPEVYRFRLADERVFSVDFSVRTRSNRALEEAPVLERRRSTSSQVFFRDVSIESSESFSFVENLRDYVKIDSAGNYIIEGRLWPELLRMADRQQALVNTNGTTPKNSTPLNSNRLALQIKTRAIIGEDGLPVALDVETGAALLRDKLVPDQVVRWTLEARQKSQWEKFFLYLDIEKMIMRDGSRQRRWRAESEEGRKRMEANYRSELQKTKIDGDISAIPYTFQIENTNYNASEGTVVVLEKFKTGDYIERKRYTYYLEKEDEFWSIVDYTVMNLGTE
ncbi:MAG: hypothetical protein LBG79_04140 [Spirochaetaceae bacterium]|jgi:hypothetical protein|nr:hypothetical protein [Spirochaetaceae bacterium]